MPVREVEETYNENSLTLNIFIRVLHEHIHFLLY